MVPFFSKAIVYAYGLAVGAFLLAGLRGWFRKTAFLVLGLQLVGVPILFALSKFSWFASEPRYLAGLYCSLPLAMAWAAMALFRRSKILATALPLAVGITSLVVALRTPSTVFSTIFDDPTAPLVRFMEDHGLRHFYSNYWITYRLMFESTPDPYTPPPLVGATYFHVVLNRYEDYTREVESDPRAAYITWPGETREFEELLAAKGRTYRRQDIGRFTVFYEISPPLE